MTENSLTRRKFIQMGSLSLLSTAIFFGHKAFATPAHIPFNPVRFAVISDPHLDIKGKNNEKMSAVSVECLRETIKDVNQEKALAFVFVLGDLLQDGEWENARVAKSLLDQLSVPYYIICGNHDYKPIPKKQRDGFHYMSVEEFVKFFNGHGFDNTGKRYYAHQIKPGLRLIGLDACLPNDPQKWGGVLPEEQLTWLDKQLTNHANELNLIFIHHSIIRWSTDELPGGPKQSFCIDNDVEVKTLLSNHAKAAPLVINGHRHIGLNVKEVNGVNYFTVPSLNSHPLRYSVFSLSNQAVSWKTPMVSIPETVHWEAKQNLLNSKVWRQTPFKERNAVNDSAVLQFYENNHKMFGSIGI